ncbi:hypothetical protein [Rhizobium ruizarguesonis]|uniref:hypothetical protein n=1 Tax=Rhizobium ruizarguesonis TaxID=2081791 RepID=UPI0010316A85|nr:hypothetical protein [Rhizobium ruizarguesonis]TAZ68249.1 hypothetical protein ELH68_32690 [Rhizobium ruizarguesonis]TAZ92279.1 hypothetical protein ELH64_25760 [Rhizobium ruizarguesonis]
MQRTLELVNADVEPALRQRVYKLVRQTVPDAGRRVFIDEDDNHRKDWFGGMTDDRITTGPHDGIDRASNVEQSHVITTSAVGEKITNHLGASSIDRARRRSPDETDAKGQRGAVVVNERGRFAADDWLRPGEQADRKKNRSADAGCRQRSKSPCRYRNDL